MKILAVAALLCALMALTPAAPAAEEEPEEAPAEDLMEVEKRTWRYYSGRYFLYVPKEMSWQEADNNCRRMGGLLASVDTYNEYQHIRSLMSNSGAGSVWLGSFYSFDAGRWVWSDGTPFKRQHWCSQPYNTGTQRCLLMNYIYNKKCWNDERCEHRFPSICARKA
ncbi:type-2 ice-structuring protein-like [Halichoeres trimaculatus]|uniref:type-2 ice-structuring protein-like n=1 Tax=Halichoeres trimaculatus TaxID=147232 RepID=UPI003D9DF1D9